MFWKFALVVEIFISFIVGHMCLDIEDGDSFKKNRDFKRMESFSIRNGIYKRVPVSCAIECSMRCLSEENCKSTNYQETGEPMHQCELSDMTASSPAHLKLVSGYSHYTPTPLETRHDCPCKNGAACFASNATAAGYECMCWLASSGTHCEYMSGTCKDIYDKTSFREDASYKLLVDSVVTDVYCHMSNICGSGGWTLVMKINGSKDTFVYSSSHWTSKTSFNSQAAKTGLDDEETKLATYWNTSFTKLCLGLKVGNKLNWILMRCNAKSLYDVIADGQYRNVSGGGRQAWLDMIDDSNLQRHCNLEGFNSAKKLRIGITANNEDHECYSVDSYIGVGWRNSAHTAGNHCMLYCRVNLSALGYVLVQ